MNMTKFISNCFGIIAGFRFPRTLQIFINKEYVRAFKINLSEFAPLESYKSLNELFTRGLKHLRDFDKNENIGISPCDGLIMERGIVESGKALQVKGYSYSIQRLLGGDKLDSSFTFINLYLSPSNYHRYHAPCDFFVESITHFKGKLLPVNMRGLKKHQNLFIKNERVVLKGRDSFGEPFYFVAVGALNVGQILFYIEPRLQDKYQGPSRKFTYTTPIKLHKGDEIGMFKMGSTILLFAKNIEILERENVVRFGESVFRKIQGGQNE